MILNNLTIYIYMIFYISYILHIYNIIIKYGVLGIPGEDKEIEMGNIPKK